MYVCGVVVIGRSATVRNGALRDAPTSVATCGSQDGDSREVG